MLTVTEKRDEKVIAAEKYSLNLIKNATLNSIKKTPSKNTESLDKKYNSSYLYKW